MTGVLFLLAFLAHFVSVHGELILAAPPAEGFNLVAYALPLLLLIVGALGMILSGVISIDVEVRMSVEKGSEIKSLKNLIVDAGRSVEIKKEAVHLPSWDPNDRQIWDCELLLNGAFSPLEGYLTQADVLAQDLLFLAMFRQIVLLQVIQLGLYDRMSR